MIEKLTPGDYPKKVNVLIEISKGTRNKYEIDKETGFLKLDRVLYSSVVYPCDYGFVPKTLCDDGDPLDALLITRFPLLPGTLVEARPLGYLEMIDTGEKDEKLLCVPSEDPYFNDFKDLKDVPQALLDEISHFFKVYKELQPKKWVKILGWKTRKDAEKLIKEAVLKYNKK
jgi:inorganic pyrophosphatase